MTSTKNLGLLPGTLERDTDHQGPMDPCWDIVGDPALQEAGSERYPDMGHGCS